MPFSFSLSLKTSCSPFYYPYHLIHYFSFGVFLSFFVFCSTSTRFLCISVLLFSPTASILLFVASPQLFYPLIVLFLSFASYLFLARAKQGKSSHGVLCLLFASIRLLCISVLLLCPPSTSSIPQLVVYCLFYPSFSFILPLYYAFCFASLPTAATQGTALTRSSLLRLRSLCINSYNLFVCNLLMNNSVMQSHLFTFRSASPLTSSELRDPDNDTISMRK